MQIGSIQSPNHLIDWKGGLRRSGVRQKTRPGKLSYGSPTIFKHNKIVFGHFCNLKIEEKLVCKLELEYRQKTTKIREKSNKCQLAHG
jgi:hypothetical protein